jgi:hypothetical protein
MTSLPLPRFALPFVLLGATLAPATDLKIVTTYTMGPSAIPPTVITNYYTQSRSRREYRNGAGHAAHPGDKTTFTWGPRQAILQQCDARHTYMLDLDAHEFTVNDLDEHGRAKGIQPVHVSTPKDAGSLEIYLDTVDTGERKEMFGHTARHIITRERRVASPGSCAQSNDSETDGWYIDLDVPQGCEGAQRKAKSIGFLAAGPAGCLKNLQVHRTGVAESGFPVQQTVTTHSSYKQADGTEKEFTSTNASEVTELSELPLDKALFEVPAGFKQVSKLNTQPPVPTTVAIQLWWERLKRSVRGIFG